LGVRQRHTRFKPKPRAWRRIDNKGHAITHLPLALRHRWNGPPPQAPDAHR
jgi:hypothetical protein